MNQNVKNINVITLGNSFVGKTSIIKRIKDGQFDENVKATISLDFFTIKRPYDKKNMIISLNFRDTSGYEMYQYILPKQYIHDSHIVLLVFDSIETLNDLIKRWYNFYKENANIDNSRFILVGNKSDIFGTEREEIIRQGEKFAEDIDAVFITCSAKSADNMDNLERFILTESKRFIDDEDNKKNNDKNNIDKQNKDKLTLDKNNSNNSTNKKGGCC